MVTQIAYNYYHPDLNIAVENVRNVWLLNETPVKLSATLHRATWFSGCRAQVKE
jgi:hypothetical protein